MTSMFCFENYIYPEKEVLYQGWYFNLWSQAGAGERQVFQSYLVCSDVCCRVDGLCRQRWLPERLAAGSWGMGQDQRRSSLGSIITTSWKKAMELPEAKTWAALWPFFFRCKTVVALPDSSEFSPLEDTTAFINVSLHLSSHNTCILLRHNAPIMP